MSFTGPAAALVAAASLIVSSGVVAPSQATTVASQSGHRLSETPTEVLASPIKHIVFIVKENHTFDNYFGTFPGADGATTGRLSDGSIVRLGHTPDPLLADVEHTPQAAQTAYNHGKMNGFDKIAGTQQGHRDVALSQYYESDIPNYWAYARHFLLADHFFTPVLGPSFPNHLVTIAGTPHETIATARPTRGAATAVLTPRCRQWGRRGIPTMRSPALPCRLWPMAWRQRGSPGAITPLR